MGSLLDSWTSTDRIIRKKLKWKYIFGHIVCSHMNGKNQTDASFENIDSLNWEISNPWTKASTKRKSAYLCVKHKNRKTSLGIQQSKKGFETGILRKNDEFDTRINSFKDKSLVLNDDSSSASSCNNGTCISREVDITVILKEKNKRNTREVKKNIMPPKIIANISDKTSDFENQEVVLKKKNEKRRKCVENRIPEGDENSQILNKYKTAEVSVKKDLPLYDSSEHISTSKVSKSIKKKKVKNENLYSVSHSTQAKPTNTNKMNKSNKDNNSNVINLPRENNKNVDSTTNKTNALLEALLEEIYFEETVLIFDDDKIDQEIFLSPSDRKSIYTYSTKIGALDNYNLLLKTVNFIEKQSPRIKNYILGMKLLEGLGESERHRYNKILKFLKTEMIKVSKVIKPAYFGAYKDYILWLYEQRQKR